MAIPKVKHLIGAAFQFRGLTLCKFQILHKPAYEIQKQDIQYIFTIPHSYLVSQENPLEIFLALGKCGGIAAVNDAAGIIFWKTPDPIMFTDIFTKDADFRLLLAFDRVQHTQQ